MFSSRKNLTENLKKAARSGNYVEFQKLINDPDLTLENLKKANVAVLLVEGFIRNKCKQEATTSEKEIAELLELCKQKGVSLNCFVSEYSRKTLLMLSAEEGFAEITQVIAKHHKNAISYRNNEGISAIDYAAIYGNLEVFKILYEKIKLAVDANNLNKIILAMISGGNVDIIKFVFDDQKIKLSREWFEKEVQTTISVINKELEKCYKEAIFIEKRFQTSQITQEQYSIELSRLQRTQELISAQTTKNKIIFDSLEQYLESPEEYAQKLNSTVHNTSVEDNQQHTHHTIITGVSWIDEFFG